MNFCRTTPEADEPKAFQVQSPQAAGARHPRQRSDSRGADEGVHGHGESVPRLRDPALRLLAGDEHQGVAGGCHQGCAAGGSTGL